MTTGDGVKNIFRRALKRSGGWSSWGFGQRYLRNEIFETPSHLASSCVTTLWRHSHCVTGFETELFILGEEKHEFDELHHGFVEELRPSGRMEEELVLEIAKLHWRKRRVERFYVNEAHWLQTGEQREDIEWMSLINTAIVVKSRPCQEIWEQMLPMLPKVFREDIKNEFKCPSKDCDDEWIEQLKSFISDRIGVGDSAIQNKRQSVRFLGGTQALGAER